MKSTALRKKFTNDNIRALTIKDARYRVWDVTVPQLFISVWPSGIKSFNVQWSREKMKALGTFPGMTVEMARAQAVEILASVHKHGKPTDPAPKAVKGMTLRVFLDEYYAPFAAQQKAGTKTYKSLLSTFDTFLNFDIADADAWPMPLTKWVAARFADDKAIGTVNRNVASLHSALNKAVKKWRLIKANPIAGVIELLDPDNSRIRHLDHDEEGRLRTQLAKRDRECISMRHRTNKDRKLAKRPLLPEPARGAYFDFLTPLVLLALNTGMRRGELQKLEWPQINFAANTIYIKAGAAKSNKARVIPLTVEARKILKKWRDETKGMGLVFTFGEFRKTWATLLENAKIEDFHFHDLRHTFASQLVMTGKKINDVRELLGHATEAMTLRYAHLSPNYKAEIVAGLVPRLTRVHSKKVA